MPVAWRGRTLRVKHLPLLLGVLIIVHVHKPIRIEKGVLRGVIERDVPLQKSGEQADDRDTGGHGHLGEHEARPGVGIHCSDFQLSRRAVVISVRPEERHILLGEVVRDPRGQTLLPKHAAALLPRALHERREARVGWRGRVRRVPVRQVKQPLDALAVRVVGLSVLVRVINPVEAPHALRKVRVQVAVEDDVPGNSIAVPGTVQRLDLVRGAHPECLRINQ
mmetsp:Transcript_150129/g.262224  ORF Transcript_150129/g.262224 Transcript_150129/m.262224 type:complete len:222 (+) Transcript_150129:2470-3135(+)